MKRLASVVFGFTLIGVACLAGQLDMGLGAGPSFTSLDSVNQSIGVFNTLVDHLNETFDVHPDVTGTIPMMSTVGTGLYLSAIERYRLTDWLALGAHVEYAGSSSATEGVYQGADVSQIAVSYRSHLLGAVLGGDITFVDVGIQLGATAGIGYFYSILDRTAVIQIPEEYPEAIAGLPPEGDARYTGGALGIEAGISLAYRIFDWFSIGTHVTYRSANVGSMTASQGIAMDLDNDGQSDSLNLSGFAVQFSFSIQIDLSLDGGKESLQ